MADFDFEAPSFSLGLDYDHFDLDPQITRTTQVDDFETLIVDDSEPDYPDPHPYPNRLFRTGEKSSSRRKFSRKSKNDELSSSGWVNPKFSVDKVTTKEAAKRTVHRAHQSPGQWLTGSDGKKVYVGKNGQELTGRVAYMRYKKENGAGFKKSSKRRFFTKKKK